MQGKSNSEHVEQKVTFLMSTKGRHLYFALTQELLSGLSSRFSCFVYRPGRRSRVGLCERVELRIAGVSPEKQRLHFRKPQHLATIGTS